MPATTPGVESGRNFPPPAISNAKAGPCRRLSTGGETTQNTRWSYLFSPQHNQTRTMKAHTLQAVLPPIVLIAIAAAPVMAQPDADPVRAAITSLVPNAGQIVIADSPVQGMKQVTIDAQVVYVSADGRYLLQGKMFDLETRTDLTEDALSVQRRAILEAYPADKQITFSPKGEKKYDITVFTDIDCGYCRRLHSQIDEYNALGIAVHYMFFPRSGPATPSFSKAVSVWCADDRLAALTAAKQGNDPLPAECANPVAEQYEIGNRIGMTGTPAIILANGLMIRGYMPPEQLAQHLQTQKNLAAR